MNRDGAVRTVAAPNHQLRVTPIPPLHVPFPSQLTGTVIHLEVPCCGLARLGKSLWVACADRTLHNFHIKGKRSFTVSLPDKVAAMVPMNMASTHGTSSLAVALGNGEVRREAALA